MSFNEEEVEKEVLDSLFEAKKEIECNLNLIEKIIKQKPLLKAKSDVDKLLKKIKKRVDYTVENWDWELRE